MLFPSFTITLHNTQHIGDCPPPTVFVCILRQKFLDAEDVGFELLASSDTMRQPGLAADFCFQRV